MAHLQTPLRNKIMALPPGTPMTAPQANRTVARYPDDLTEMFTVDGIEGDETVFGVVGHCDKVAKTPASLRKCQARSELGVLFGTQADGLSDALAQNSAAQAKAMQLAMQWLSAPMTERNVQLVLSNARRDLPLDDHLTGARRGNGGGGGRDGPRHPSEGAAGADAGGNGSSRLPQAPVPIRTRWSVSGATPRRQLERARSGGIERMARASTPGTRPGHRRRNSEPSCPTYASLVRELGSPPTAKAFGRASSGAGPSSAGPEPLGSPPLSPVSPRLSRPRDEERAGSPLSGGRRSLGDERTPAGTVPRRPLPDCCFSSATCADGGGHSPQASEKRTPRSGGTGGSLLSAGRGGDGDGRHSLEKLLHVGSVHSPLSYFGTKPDSTGKYCEPQEDEDLLRDAFNEAADYSCAEMMVDMVSRRGSLMTAAPSPTGTGVARLWARMAARPRRSIPRRRRPRRQPWTRRGSSPLASRGWTCRARWRDS